MVIDPTILKTLFAGLATDAKAVNLVATQTPHGTIFGVDMDAELKDLIFVDAVVKPDAASINFNDPTHNFANKVGVAFATVFMPIVDEISERNMRTVERLFAKTAKAAETAYRAKLDWREMFPGCIKPLTAIKTLAEQIAVEEGVTPNG